MKCDTNRCERWGIFRRKKAQTGGTHNPLMKDMAETGSHCSYLSQV